MSGIAGVGELQQQDGSIDAVITTSSPAALVSAGQGQRSRVSSSDGNLSPRSRSSLLLNTRRFSKETALVEGNAVVSSASGSPRMSRIPAVLEELETTIV